MKFTVVLALWMLSITVFAKPKPLVQLYAQDIEYMMSTKTVTVYLVLPDGSYAQAECSSYSGDTPCIIEPARVEMRVSENCGADFGKAGVLCIKHEFYPMYRKGNDIVIYAPNGKIIYHIVGSW